jgi:hypothetical protein
MLTGPGVKSMGGVDFSMNIPFSKIHVRGFAPVGMLE